MYVHTGVVHRREDDADNTLIAGCGVDAVLGGTAAIVCVYAYRFILSYHAWRLLTGERTYVTGEWPGGFIFRPCGGVHVGSGRLLLCESATFVRMSMEVVCFCFFFFA